MSLNFSAQLARIRERHDSQLKQWPGISDWAADFGFGSLEYPIAHGIPLNAGQRNFLVQNVAPLVRGIAPQFDDRRLWEAFVSHQQFLQNPADDTLGGLAFAADVFITLGAVGTAALGSGAEAAAPAGSSSGATAAAGGGALITQAAATADSVVNDVTSPISDTLDNAGKIADSSLGDALSSVKDFVSTAKSTLSDIFGPIGDVLHQITSAIKDINENVVKPIVGPITATMDAVKTLTDNIHRDLQSGIKGILNIPADIGRAFDSVDATVQRSLAMWAQVSGDNQRAILGELLKSGKGQVVGDSAAGIHAALASTIGAFTPPPAINLSEPESIEQYKEWAKAQQEELFKDGSIVGAIFRWIFMLTGVLEGLVAQREPYVEIWREQIFKAAGHKKLDTSNALALAKRGELSREQVQEELTVQGLSESRVDALLALTRELPDTGRVLSLFARRWIDDINAKAMLAALGWQSSDIELLLNSAQTELGSDTLLELVRRGLLKEDEAAVALERQGMRQFDAGVYLASRWRLLGLADVITLTDRALSAGAGKSFPTLAQEPPAELSAFASKLGIDAESARVLWSNHWRLLTPELSVQAYFRGYINADQLDTALAQASIPPELRQNYIDLQRPLIPFRSITTLMGQGIVSDQDALAILRSRGFSDRDANWLVQIQRAGSAPSQAKAASELHGLTKQTVLQLYEAGTATRDEARAQLLELGLAEHAADAELSLHDVRTSHAERMAEIDDVIAQARAGLMPVQDAEGQLAALNLTAAELARARGKLHRTVRSGTKMPSDTQLLAMWKKGIIDDATTMEALQLSGYSEMWTQALIDLEGQRGAKAPRSQSDTEQPQ